MPTRQSHRLARRPVHPGPPEPHARRSGAASILHGVRVADPYRWLEDQTSAETQRWLFEQSWIADEWLRRLPDQQRWRQGVTAMAQTQADRLATLPPLAGPPPSRWQIVTTATERPTGTEPWPALTLVDTRGDHQPVSIDNPRAPIVAMAGPDDQVFIEVGAPPRVTIENPDGTSVSAIIDIDPGDEHHDTIAIPDPVSGEARIPVWEARPPSLLRVDIDDLNRVRISPVAVVVPGRRIDQLRVIGETLVVRSVVDQVEAITLHNLDGSRRAAVLLPGTGRVTPVGLGADGSIVLRYEDQATPSLTMHVDPRSGAVRQTDADPTLPRVVTRLIQVPGTDGTMIPVLLSSRSDIGNNANRPTILTAYGGWGESQSAGFSAEAAAWVAQGGVWATACVRGGGERGAPWHRAGMRDKHVNSLADLNDVAEWLVAQRITSPAHITLQGASHGGMLVTEAMLARPDLYAAVIADSPVTDQLRCHDEPNRRLEHGDRDNPAEFPWLLAESSAYGVRPGVRYPALLVRTGGHDPKVEPWQGHKLVAALQAGGDRPVLLRHDPHGGHCSSSAAALGDMLAFAGARTGLVVGLVDRLRARTLS